MTVSKPRVLYIVYWGAGEPLGQSLVVPAVKCLAELGVDLTLITFEKPSDLDQPEYILRIRDELKKVGVSWLPLRYHKSPKVPATLLDIARGVARSIASRVRGRFDIVHARTFVGGLIGILIAPLLGAKLIYHNEGFYPDEQVDGGVWRENSSPHRLAKALERRLYEKARGIIAISERGRVAIAAMPGMSGRETPIIVIPSCVDLELFRRSAIVRHDEELRLVHSGSVGGRYLIDRVGRFAAVAAREFGRVHLQLLTRAAPEVVTPMLAGSGLAEDSWSVQGVPYEEMPQRLARADVGLSFRARGLSEHGCSPTKIGEYWAMGLPVVATTNANDIDDIIRREGVGVLVAGHRDDDYKEAAQELRELLRDSEVGDRCRRAAERHYALGPACVRQFDLYCRLTRNTELGVGAPSRGGMKA